MEIAADPHAPNRVRPFLTAAAGHKKTRRVWSRCHAPGPDENMNRCREGLRAGRRAGSRGRRSAELAQPDGEVVDADRAAAVVIRTTERGVARRTEVAQPHREVVHADAVRAVEIERRHRRRTDEHAILEDPAAALERDVLAASRLTAQDVE